MTDQAEVPTGVEAQRTLARWMLELHGIRSPILRYGFAVVSVAVGLGLALLLNYRQFRDVEVPVLTMSIALTTWYAGTGPSVLAIVLSTLCFDYFFTEPFYSFSISSQDLPYFLVFIAWGASFPHSALFDAGSTTGFVKPATGFRSSWTSVSAEKTKFASSIRNSPARQ